jgi:hypothetical protein
VYAYDAIKIYIVLTILTSFHNKRPSCLICSASRTVSCLRQHPFLSNLASGKAGLESFSFLVLAADAAAAGDLERLEERDLDRERDRVLDAATVAEHMMIWSEE